MKKKTKLTTDGNSPSKVGNPPKTLDSLSGRTDDDTKAKIVYLLIYFNF